MVVDPMWGGSQEGELEFKEATEIGERPVGEWHLGMVKKEEEVALSPQYLFRIPR